MFAKNKNKRGFTLIEIMLVVALIVAIGGLSVPVYQSFQVKKNLDVATNGVVQTLRRAQALSQSGAEDSAWGVQISTGSVTLFKGLSYVSRDSDFDEVLEISSGIIPSGISEIVFSKLLGEPQAIGNIILTSNNNDSETIIINSKGTVDY